MMQFQDYYIEGDIDNLLLAVEDQFRVIKNKFVYPAKSLTSLKTKPAKYVHKCNRDPTCQCVYLTQYLLYCLSSDIQNASWYDEIQFKLESLIYEPRLRIPFPSLVMWI